MDLHTRYPMTQPPTEDCRLNRRSFLGKTAAAVPLAYLASARCLHAQSVGEATAPAGAGLIMRQREPENLEFAFSTLDKFIVPNERFYVRNHFAVPKLDAGSWRLKVEGAVEHPLELSLEDLIKMTARTQIMTFECAGNSRVFLMPKAKGVLWESGAIGNAEWTGVPLAAVLERAGVRTGAVEVVLEGADTGSIDEDPKSPGPIHFARSLSLAKAQKQDVLLAYRMNGLELPRAHGFPLRAVVGGWYGMASVKWLTRVVVTDRPFHGYFQSLDYTIFERRDGMPTLTPITEMQVKAAIARPAFQEVVSAKSTYRVHGAAWTGDSEVVKVEVSTDAGQTWSMARLLDKAVPNAWRLWDYEWHTPERPGRQTLMARATDKHGHTQPLQRDADRRGYLISHVLPVVVEVR